MINIIRTILLLQASILVTAPPPHLGHLSEGLQNFGQSCKSVFGQCFPFFESDTNRLGHPPAPAPALSSAVLDAHEEDSVLRRPNVETIPDGNSVENVQSDEIHEPHGDGNSSNVVPGSTMMHDQAETSSANNQQIPDNVGSSKQVNQPGSSDMMQRQIAKRKREDFVFDEDEISRSLALLRLQARVRHYQPRISRAALNGTPSRFDMYQDLKRFMEAASAFAKKYAEENPCPICLEGLMPAESVKKWPICEHKFHTACISEWQKDHYSCPNCRAADESHWLYEELYSFGRTLNAQMFWVRWRRNSGVVLRDVDHQISKVWNSFEHAHPSIAHKLLQSTGSHS